MNKYLVYIYMALLALFAGLKLGGLVTTSWFVISIFLWGPFALYFALCLFLLALALVQLLIVMTDAFIKEIRAKSLTRRK